MTTPTPQLYQPVVAGYATVTPRRPPLTKRQKSGAAWGGIVGFNLLTLGFSLFLLPLVATLFWSIFAFFFANVSKSLNGSGRGPSFGDFGVDFGLWIIPVIGWLAWWWMAHALRRDATAVASAIMTTTQE